MPLSSLCVSLKALPYISWSPKCFLLWQPLLFLAPLFHLSDCLSFCSPPRPAPVCHGSPIPSHSVSSSNLFASSSLPNIPLSFPPGFFLLCRLRSPPTAAISKQKKGENFFWPGKLHLIFCICAKAIIPTGMCLCGPHSSSSFLLYLDGGYGDKKWLHPLYSLHQRLSSWYGAN